MWQMGYKSRLTLERCQEDSRPLLVGGLRNLRRLRKKVAGIKKAGRFCRPAN